MDLLSKMVAGAPHFVRCVTSVVFLINLQFLARGWYHILAIFTWTNLEILNTASSTRKLMSNVKRRQTEFLGLVMRKGKLEHLLTTGKIEGKRSRGCQRIKIQNSIAAWLGRCLWMQEIAKSGRSWSLTPATDTATEEGQSQYFFMLICLHMWKNVKFWPTNMWKMLLPTPPLNLTRYSRVFWYFRILHPPSLVYWITFWHCLCVVWYHALWTSNYCIYTGMAN